MFGWLGKLFGSKDVVDGAMKGIDALVFTDEEKSNQKLAFLKAYEPFKIAQRLLAVIFCIPYALAWIATFGMVAAGLDTVQLKLILSDDMGTIVQMIVVFYFGGGTLESLGKVMKKGQ